MISVRRDGPGFSDLLLPHALVADGVLLQRDGSLLAAWQFDGPDLESAEHDHLNSMSARIGRALKLGSGYQIHVDVIRTRSHEYIDPARCYFPDPITRVIEAEREAFFTEFGKLYRSRHYLTFTYLPPLQREEKAVSWFTGGGNKAKLSNLAHHHLETFQAAVARFEGVFGALVRARRLESVTIEGVVYDELLAYLYETITGKRQRIRRPSIPVGLADSVLATVDVVGGLDPKVGAKYLRPIAIDGFPEASFPGILAALDELALEYRWSTRAIFFDPQQAKKHFDWVTRGWRGKQRGFQDQVTRNSEGLVDEHASDMMGDARAASAEASANRVQFCNYTSVVMLMEEAPAALVAAERMVVKTIEGLGFAARVEDTNAMEAWLGSIPGDGYRNVRRMVLHTLNLADMLPLTSVWTGLAENPSSLMPPHSPPLLYGVTTGDTPFRLNFHVADLGHFLVVGPSGSGKSTMLGMTAAQWFRYPDAQVFSLDWDYSIWFLAKAVGGRHYDLMGDQSLSFCPLRFLDTASDVAWAGGWVEDLCRLNNLHVNPAHTNAINEAVRLLADSNHRTLSDLVTAVQNLEVKQALKFYTLEGPGGSMLDAAEDSLALDGGERMVAFETRALMEGRDPRLAMPVLLYLFRRIEKRLDGRPTLILLDEAWAYLAHTVFRGKIEELLRTLRRANGVVGIATQAISDIANSPIADVIFEQCPTKLLLPNAEANAQACREFYRAVGLNDREVTEQIQHGIPKQEYYAVSHDGRRKFSLAAGKLAVSLVGVTSREERKWARRIMDLNPDSWRAAWLREKGLGDWAEYLESIEQEKGEQATCIAG